MLRKICKCSFKMQRVKVNFKIITVLKRGINKWKEQACLKMPPSQVPGLKASNEQIR